MKRMPLMFAVCLVCLLATVQYAATEQQSGPDPGGAQTPVVKPKARFWDLRVAEMQINGQKADPLSDTISVELDKPVTFTCVREAMWPPVAQITEADITAWGAGNLSYAFEMSLKMNATPFTEVPNGKSLGRSQIPKITSLSQLGPNGFVGQNHPPQVSSNMTFTIKSTGTNYQGMVDLGKFMICCSVDTSSEIAETEEGNQSRCANFHVAKKIAGVPLTASQT